MTLLFPTLEALLLALAVSTDTFVAALGYGSGHIRIPPLSLWVVSLSCSGILGLSLLLGRVAGGILPTSLTGALSALLLALLGLLKLFDSSLKALIRRHRKLRRQVHFSAFHLRFILSVYADPEEADADASHLLSPGEAASLALALSLDGIAVGFGAALTAIPLPQVVLFTLFANLGALLLGHRMGEALARRSGWDLSWASGLLLLLLALGRMY